MTISSNVLVDKLSKPNYLKFANSMDQALSLFSKKQTTCNRFLIVLNLCIKWNSSPATSSFQPVGENQSSHFLITYLCLFEPEFYVLALSLSKMIPVTLFLCCSEYLLYLINCEPWVGGWRKRKTQSFITMLCRLQYELLSGPSGDLWLLGGYQLQIQLLCNLVVCNLCPLDWNYFPFTICIQNYCTPKPLILQVTAPLCEQVHVKLKKHIISFFSKHYVYILSIKHNIIVCVSIQCNARGIGSKLQFTENVLQSFL